MFLTEPNINMFKYKIVGRNESSFCNVSIQASSYIEMLSKAHDTLKICDEVYIYEFDTNHFVMAFDKSHKIILTFNPTTKDVEIKKMVRV